MDQNTSDRYFDYISTYTSTVQELLPELEAKCKRKKSWDTTIARKKYMYFSKTDGVTLINKETSLELSFSFKQEQGSTYFESNHLHNFIESDLNASGLWKNFPPNKTVRAELYSECLNTLVNSWVVEKKGAWFSISD